VLHEDLQTGAGTSDAAAPGAGGSGGGGELSEGVDFAEMTESNATSSRARRRKTGRHAAIGAYAIDSCGSNLAGSPLASMNDVAVATAASLKPSPSAADGSTAVAVGSLRSASRATADLFAVVRPAASSGVGARGDSLRAPAEGQGSLIRASASSTSVPFAALARSKDEWIRLVGCTGGLVHALSREISGRASTSWWWNEAAAGSTIVSASSCTGAPAHDVHPAFSRELQLPTLPRVPHRV